MTRGRERLFLVVVGAAGLSLDVRVSVGVNGKAAG